MAHAHTPTPHAPVTLVSISDEKEAGERCYFMAHFKRGLLGRPVVRTFWGTLTVTDDGTASVTWERASPDDLRSVMGQDLASEVEVVAVDIEPEEFTSEVTGEVRTVESRTIVRFKDETLAQACRKYGSHLKETASISDPETAITPPQAAPLHGMPGHYVVAANGKGAPAI